MANMLFANNCNTTLSSSLSSGATSMSVTSATGFPSPTGVQYFYCTLADAATQSTIEIVKVTSVTGTTFAITRAQDGTSATAFAAGAVVSLRLVRASLNDFPKLDETNTFNADQSISGALTTSAGLVTTSTFTATPPSDGLVMDYATGFGRFSAFAGDGFQWYNAGVANTKLMQLSSSGAITTATWNGATVTVPYGGTGLTTLTAGYIPYGNGTSAFNSSSNLYFSGTQLGIGTTTVASGNSVSQSNINANGGGVQIGYPTNGGLLISGLSGGGAIFTKYTGSQGSETYVEAVRLDNSGNLLVGTTGANGKVAAYATSSDGNRSVFRGDNTNTNYGGTFTYLTCTTGLSTGYDFIGAYANGTTAFRVRGDGTIFAQNTTVQSASDTRFKENVVDATDGLDVISALRPVRFDFKEGFGNNKKNQIGFIAQEIKTVFPDAVDVWGESNDPNNPYLSVGSGALIPVLVKALQELNNKFDAYVASHP